MMADYTLRLSGSVLHGTPWVGDLTGVARQWRRSIRFWGGFWQGSFKMETDAPTMQQAFYEWLGYHLEEKSAGVTTWEGMIYELDLVTAGVRRRRSLDLTANAMMARYTNDDNEAQESAWATDADSITRYGRKENVVMLDGLNQTAAEGRRDVALRESAWPWPRPVSVSSAADCLEVRVCGYVFTANWRYVTTADGNSGPVSDWINSIIATDCDFLRTGKITANSLSVTRELSMAARCWDVLYDLAELGDGANPMQLWVDTGRRVHYAPVDVTPRHHLRAGGVYDGAGGKLGADIYRLRPGVIRDQSYPVKRQEPGSFLDDARDIFVEEVEVADGKLTLKTGLFSESDILAVQEKG